MRHKCINWESDRSSKTHPDDAADAADAGAGAAAVGTKTAAAGVVGASPFISFCSIHLRFAAASAVSGLSVAIAEGDLSGTGEEGNGSAAPEFATAIPAAASTSTPSAVRICPG